MAFFSSKDRSGDTVREADRTGDKLHDLDHDVRQLQKDLSRVRIAFQALWELTEESGGITEEQLQRKISEIEARTDDGPDLLKPQFTSCPECRRNVLSDRKTCIYCGAFLHGGDDGRT